MVGGEGRGEGCDGREARGSLRGGGDDELFCFVFDFFVGVWAGRVRSEIGRGDEVEGSWGKLVGGEDAKARREGTRERKKEGGAWIESRVGK